ncbi:H-NS family nucleoid-associated regulatory protein [Pantoea sp. PNA 03-3]|uniref:H-NS family nucleoid-associated regulatory protein n=1 Tax=Pantoea sp. PNA 03-3 TaxID=2135460 RepID=UPI000D75217C|nr:H-NS family nucleoid-associated regulatory protein [Pantoea sp. PNA 03-3]PXV70954.1 DNA-binding protein H-NS [Pantoea sp. PNA 03-3]
MSEHNDYGTCAVIMCERRKATAVLRKIPPENLEQLINMWSDIAQGMIENYKEEQKATEQKLEATKQFMEKHNISSEEAMQIFENLFGPSTKSKSTFGKVKYRIEVDGKPVTWTGKGRRPNAFEGMSKEELKKYEIS